MAQARTTVAVHGFTPGEVTAGMPHLRAELAERNLLGDVRWDEATGRLLVTVESADLGPRTTALHEDQVWDCVMACVNFSGKRIRFERVAN